MAPNLSVFAIPALWVLTLFPHAYSVTLIKNANNGRWDNANSKSSKWDEKLQKTIPAETYARYERAEAAHRNGMENMPLFIGTIALGNLAKLDASTLNAFAATYLALRLVYTLLYINTTNIKRSYYRTLTWGVSTLLAFGVIIKAGFQLV